MTQSKHTLAVFEIHNIGGYWYQLLYSIRKRYRSVLCENDIICLSFTDNANDIATKQVPLVYCLPI